MVAAEAAAGAVVPVVAAEAGVLAAEVAPAAVGVVAAAARSEAAGSEASGSVAASAARPVPAARVAAAAHPGERAAGAKSREKRGPQAWLGRACREIDIERSEVENAIADLIGVVPSGLRKAAY
jgi:hypothetical protein